MSPEGSFSNLIHYMDWMDYSSSIDNMFNVAYDMCVYIYPLDGSRKEDKRYFQELQRLQSTDNISFNKPGALWW